MDRNQEAAWEDYCAAQDYRSEAFGGSAVDAAREAYYDYCDNMEAVGEVPEPMEAWNKACQVRAEASFIATAPEVDNSDVPF